MKKIIMLSIFLFILFSDNVYALEYNSELSGSDSIYTDKDDTLSSRYATSLYINISNIENIGSFTMYVKYDKDLVGLSTCGFFNYIDTGCHVTDDRDVVYHYKYTDGYSEYFNKYNFYKVRFMAKPIANESQTTQVEVVFKDAKDKDQNPITINSSSKTYTFTKLSMTLKPSEGSTGNNNSSSNDSQITTGSDVTNSTEVDNNQSSTDDDVINPDDSNDKDESQIITDNNTNNSNETDNQKQDQSTINSNVTNSTIVNNNKSESNYQKSSNNYAGMIEIEDFEFNFDKEKTEYTIYIDELVNKLHINVTVDDNKATYRIIGAEDLKLNDYKVLIEITAENNTKRTYVINTKLNEKEVSLDEVKEEIQQEVPKKEVDNNNFILGCVIFGSTFIIGMIVVIVLKIKGRKRKY